ncbi:putative sodium-coupled neutral amino acid transporter 7 [Limulus polyphemus]|uniref:Sodium-coupled neutral amino acid transporter 7 n=1 Tax=Limulus polyphemus TaxID=6850 RepID=A0ABM1S436_LIMPO|nr:putative sodium-coupled neutral amino acid transporter 7 [Limulus polyphemus]
MSIQFQTNEASAESLNRPKYDETVDVRPLPVVFCGSTSSVELTDDFSSSAEGDIVINNIRQQPKITTEGSSWYAAVFLVVNAALGAGLLDFPQAFDQAGGILVAIIVQAVLIAFVVGALVILAYCSDRNNSSTYQEVVLAVCGKKVQQLCAVTVILYCYGTCITFIIIIGDQFERVFASLYGNDFCHYWYMNRNFTMITSCVLLILPLCFPRRIDFLKYASTVGVLAVLYVVFLIIYKYYEGSHEAGPIKTSPDVWTELFLVVPVICFSYQCHVSCVPVYSCLKDRRVSVFLKTVIVAILICMFTYTVAATFGYLTFGSLVTSDILESYDANDPVVLVGIVALAAKTYTTYPILLFCGRTAIDDIYIQVRSLPPELAARGERMRRIITALVWFITTLTLAVVTPNIGVVIQLLGSLAAVFIFVFPGLCLLQETLRKDPSIILLKDKFLVFVSGVFLAIGMGIFGLVLTQSIAEDINSPSEVERINLYV